MSREHRWPLRVGTFGITALCLGAPLAWAGPSDGSGPVNHRVAFDLRCSDRFAWPTTPAVTEEGLVVVGAPDGRVVASTHEGTLAWERSLIGPVGVNLAVVGGRVLAIDGVGAIHGLDPGTGADLWASSAVGSRPVGVAASGGERLYWTAADRTLRANSALTGEPFWQRPLSVPTESGATVSGDLVIVATMDGTVHAFAARDGAPRWESKLGALTRAAAAGADGRVVIGARDGVLHALDAASGVSAWSVNVGGLIDGTATVEGGRVLVGSTAGSVVAVELATGAPLGRHDARGPVVGSPTLGGGMAVVGTSRGVALGIDAATGRGLFQVGVGSGIDGSPALSRGRAWWATADGRLVAVGDSAFVAATASAAGAPWLEGDAVWFGDALPIRATQPPLARPDNPDQLALLDAEGRLHRTLDGGTGWTPVRGPPVGRISRLLAWWGQDLAVTVGHQVWVLGGATSLWRKWEGAPAGLEAPGNEWWVDGDLVAVWGDRLWTSMDGGQTFAAAAASGRPDRVMQDRALPSLLWLGLPDGRMWASRDGGATWAPEGAPGGRMVGFASGVGGPDEVLAISAEGALLRSTDRGVSFSRVDSVPPDDAIVDLAWDPVTRASLIATASGQVLASQDGGLVWSTRGAGLGERGSLRRARFSRNSQRAVLLGGELASGHYGVFRLGRVATHRRLEAVQFQTGSAELGPEGVAAVAELAARMNADPRLRLRAEGHTDDVGPDDDNLVLSVRRARSVAQVAIRGGVAADRTLVLGFGEARPLVPNDSPGAQARNRRVDVYLIGAP